MNQKRRNACASVRNTGISLFAALGVALAALAGGCGGAKVNPPLRETQAADPTVFGLQPLGTAQVSGLLAGDESVGYITGAVASDASPLSQIAVNGTIALGFSPGATYADGSSGEAVAPGASVVFRAYLSNGTNPANAQVIPINPHGVVLTSSEVSGFSIPLTFGPTATGPLAGNGQYATAAFALPFTTTGLHSLTVSVTDQLPQTSSTTFDVLVLDPADSAVLAQVLDADGNPVPGATATITNPISGARAQTTADAQGVVILFAAPGTQTITVSGTDLSYTADVTLTAGQALVLDAEGAPLAIAPPAS